MKNSVYDNGGFIGRVANYTATDSYTQTVTATDPHLSNVTLLIKFEGTDGGTTFTDISPNNCTITGHNATTSTAVSKFGASSGYFGGSTSAYVYVSSADSGVSDFGTGDFTVEMFVYRTTSLADRYFDNRQNTSSGTFLIISTPTSPGNALRINIGSTSYNTTNTIPTNQWSHIAVTRESGTVRAFIDGVLGVTGTNNTASITDGTNSNYPPLVGGMGYAWGGATGTNHDGYIDELRVTKGVARYTANFTPPTASYGQAVVTGNKKNTGVWSMDADYLNAELADTSLDIDTVYGTTYLREITSFPSSTFSSGSDGSGQIDVTWIFDMTFSTTDTGCILDQGGGQDGLYVGMVSGGNLRLSVSGAVSGVSNETSTTTTDMSAYAGVAGQLIVTIDYQNHIQCWWNDSTNGINQIVSVDFNGNGDWAGTNSARVGQGSSVHGGQSDSVFTGTLTRYREITTYVDTSTF